MPAVRAEGSGDGVVGVGAGDIEMQLTGVPTGDERDGDEDDPRIGLLSSDGDKRTNRLSEGL